MNTLADLTSLAIALEPLGVELPDEATSIIELRTAALAAATTTAIDDLRADVVSGAVKPAAIAKRVEAAATAVIVKAAVRDVLRELEPGFDRMARRWARANGDNIIEQLKPTFATAGDQLAAAVAELGVGIDASDVLARGAAAAAAWQHREDARATLHAVRKARRALAAAGYGEIFEDVSWYVADIGTTEELERARGLMDKHAFDVEAVVGASFTLRLNTLRDAEQLVTAAAAGSDAERLARSLADPATQAHNARVEAQNRALMKAAGR